MFFAASKILWGLVQPSHIILWCAVAAAILLILDRRRVGLGFIIGTALLLIGLGVVPSYNLIGLSLEDEYASVSLPGRVDGILMLGGGSEDIHRMPAAYILARRYPRARVVYSGGSGALLHNTPDVDGKKARAFFIALGLDPARLTVEGRSRNTFENFVFSKALVKPKSVQSWILVTSAYHMPRSMQIAKQVGWKVSPSQSDRFTSKQGLYGWFNIPVNLRFFDMIFREQVGLIAYRWTGRSRE